MDEKHWITGLMEVELDEGERFQLYKAIGRCTANGYPSLYLPSTRLQTAITFDFTGGARGGEFARLRQLRFPFAD